MKIKLQSIRLLMSLKDNILSCISAQKGSRLPPILELKYPASAPSSTEVKWMERPDDSLSSGNLFFLQMPRIGRMNCV